MSRREQIIALLRTLDDGLPTPGRRPLSSAGFVHRTVVYETCPDCLTNGFVSRDCETCQGRGHLEERRNRDPYDTGRSLSFGAPKHEAAHERDREIARLEAQTAPPATEADLLAATRPDAWEVERRKLREEFDYRPLERALEALRAGDLDAYRALYAVYVHGWLPDTGGATSLCERGLVLLDALMPDPIRAPIARTVEQPAQPLTVAERNRRIRKLQREGATSQWLAREFGLTVRRVDQIIAGETEAVA